MSKLKLKTPLGGSVALAATNTASDVTLTLPANTTNLIGASELGSSSGAGMVGYMHGGVGAVATDVQDKLDEYDSIFNYMTSGQITAAKSLSTTQDLSSVLNTAFSSGNKTIRLVGPARYTIGFPIYLTSGLTVLCDDNAEIYLKDMARCFMIRTVTTGLTNIKWIGGIVNGNDVNQGDQVADGAAFDISKAFYLVNVNGMEVGNLTIKTVRGHGINHWNCNNFHFHDIKFDQTIDAITPTGGKRRDGVTGSSSNGLIENISGYTNDDMVALLCGVEWAGVGTVAQNIENVSIKNIRGQTKDGQNTWRGAVVYTLSGYKADKINIDGVYGDFAEAIIQVGSYDPLTTGIAGCINVSNFGGKAMRTVGGGNRTPVYIYNVNVDNLNLSNGYVEYDDTYVGANSASIVVSKSTINTLKINSITIVDKRTSDVAHTLVKVKNDGIRELTINNASNYSTLFPTSTLKTIVIREQSGGSGTGTVNLYGSNWNIGRETTGVTKANVTVAGGILVPFSSVIVCGLSDISTPSTGALMTDYNCGVCLYDGSKWVQQTTPTRDFGSIPTTGNWKVGFRFKSYNSPYNAVSEYINLNGTAPFDWYPIPSSVIYYAPAASFSYPLSNFASGVETHFQIGGADAASFPGGIAGKFTTYRAVSGDSQAYQLYRPVQTNQIWERYWNGSAWTAFVKITVV